MPSSHILSQAATGQNDKKLDKSGLKCVCPQRNNGATPYGRFASLNPFPDHFSRDTHDHASLSQPPLQ